MGKKGLVVAAGVLAVLTVMAGVIGAVFMALTVYRYNPGIHSVYCSYMPSPASPLGLVGAALALTTQILASTAIGCCAAWRNVPSQNRRVVAVLLFVASWVLAITTVILFMVGAMLGSGGRMFFRNWGHIKNIVENGSCIAPGVGIFTAATIFFLIAVSLDIGSYILVQKEVAGSTKAGFALQKPTWMAARGPSGATKC